MRSRSSSSALAALITLLTAAALAAAVAGCGPSVGGAGPSVGGAAPSGTLVVRIVASNFAFEPDHIEVRAGQTVRFVLENPTDLPHELVIGSLPEQEAHNRAHREAATDPSPSLAEGPASVYVPARGIGQLEYRFDQPGELVIGCHIVGHWESGMRGVVIVLD